MTREEFKTIVKVLRCTYPNCLINTQQVFDLWYEMLGDLDYMQVSHNLKQHIKNNKYQPSIAELRKTPEGNRFNNFLPRGYDMAKLEAALLEADRPERRLTDEIFE